MSDPRLLLRVERPSRYLGGEVNQVRKERAAVRCAVGLCYPDVYEIGMSHLGLQVLYQAVNARDDLAAERVFCPWPDMERELRASGRRLTTLESGRPLRELDVLGFTLQFELSYTNLLTVLDLGGIPLRAADRRPADPVVIGGGPCAYNPEPLADVLDAVCLGDGEELIVEVCDAVAAWRERAGHSREALYDALCALPGVYVPSRYTIEADDLGRITRFEPRLGAPERIERRVLADLDASPTPRPVVPFGRAVHDRLAIEIQRGCARGCRFCQAGVVYRPVRERSPEAIRRAVRDGLRATGSEEVGLLSLSTGDYTCLPDLVCSLVAEHADRRIGLSLPSLRLESLDGGLLDGVRSVRRTGITLAPEAGTARLRAVINKVFDEQQLLDGIRSVLGRGWKGLKLYFMIGLPTEQQADLEGIADLVMRCRAEARRARRSAQLRVSIGTFVPKPNSPLQWSPQITVEETLDKQRALKRALGRTRVELSFHTAYPSALEGAFARGDRRLGATLLHAWRNGARMDGWGESCDPAIWDEAFRATGIDPLSITARERTRDERLPWDHLGCGADRDWLWSEFEAALESTPCHDCTTGHCYDCGVCDPPRLRNRLYDRDADGARPKAMVPARPRAHRVDGVGPEQPKEGALRHDTRLPAELRRRVRVRYGRSGHAALLSHLETVTVLQRAIRRTGAPVIHTSGFHPHMKLTFTDPNPVGMESDAEFLELEVVPPLSIDEFTQRLSAQLPAGFTVHAAEALEPGAPALGAQLRERVYRVDGLRPGVADRAASRLTAPLPVEVQRKKGARVIDLAQVARAEVVEERGLLLTLTADAGVRPGEAVEALVGADGDGADGDGPSLRKVDVRFRPWTAPEDGR